MSQVGLQQRKVPILDNHEAFQLFGHQDEHLKTIEDSFKVKIVSRGNELVISGDQEEVNRVVALFERLLGILRSGSPITGQDVSYVIRLTKEGDDSPLEAVFSDVILITPRGKKIKPKTIGQKLYVEAIRRNDIVFGIGPAGTGKTYLAMAMAVHAFKEKQVSRIILTRPAVEAGENLGFLPGDLHEKVDPYLRPLYDALYDILGSDTFEKYMTRRLIEVAPLAYMRGRTLDDSFVILDEAQNTTREQMKMFLTRLGFGSKAVVTGDITQIDLPQGKFSGLEQVRSILPGISGIQFVYLTEKDVVRHPLVQEIIKAYEKVDDNRQGPAVETQGRPA